MKLRNIRILVAAVIMIAATGIGNAFAYTLTYSGTMSSSLIGSKAYLDSEASGNGNVHVGDYVKWHNKWVNYRDITVDAKVPYEAQYALEWINYVHSVQAYSSWEDDLNPKVTASPAYPDHVINTYHYYDGIAGTDSSTSMKFTLLD